LARLPAPLPAFPGNNSGPALRACLENRGLSIRKQWGQNFLVNPRSRTAIAAALEAEGGSGVWEIGSGLGAMTAELTGRGLRVWGFEIDPGFCSILEELFPAENGGTFTLIRGDVLETWKTAPAAPYLLGNLPYVTAALLMGNLIEAGCLFNRMVVTVQKEVARRMAAPPGTKDYGSLSVLCASAYRSRIIMNLKGPSIYPVPHVESSAVRFDRLSLPPPPRIFFPLVRSLFAARRKTAANNLEHFLAASGTIQDAGERARAALLRSGIPPGNRAEELPPEAFRALAAELERETQGMRVMK
jgi:16S rRNA (adenine1518-N6/adenine1519-N6)-dimethyltransferase